VRKVGHALLYYKTDPLVFKSVAKDTSHTNHLRIVEIVKIFNKLGFWVDIIDRTADPDDIRKNIKDKYNIFIGIGAGDSGKYFPEITDRVPSAKKILYALGPDPELTKELTIKRYDYFRRRHPNVRMQVRRLPGCVDVGRVIQNTDVIFCGGSDFSAKSYRRFNKPLYKFYGAILPGVSVDIRQIPMGSPRKFLYFGGNGNIVKGLDLVIEAFVGTPDLELYICAPTWEKDFNNFYLPIIKKYPNIHFVGFVDVYGQRFEKLTKQCGFVTMLSCAEGMANSVITCMRRGLVPVVNYESGIDNMENFGFLIENLKIDELRKKYREISRISERKFKEKSIASYQETNSYAQAKFSENFEKSLIDVLMKKSELK